MRKLSLLTACLLLTLMIAKSQGQTDAPRTYTAGRNTIQYKLTIFDPLIPIQLDPARLNQDSAVNCSILFLSKLHDGDLEGAAAVTLDPGTTLREYQAAKARIGDAEFSKKMANLFTGDRYQFEIVEGKEHVLISEKHPDGARAFLEKDGKFWVDRPKLQHESTEFQNLFVLVNAHAAGTLTFK